MAFSSKPKESKLSRNVLELKFMKRAIIKAEVEKNDLEAHAIDEDHWVINFPVKKPKESRIVVESSYTACEDLKFGRFSYQGFNPEVEKLMKNKQAEKEEIASEKREEANSVSDKEMASRYTSLSDTIQKKFAPKRTRKEDNNDSRPSEVSRKKQKSLR